MNKQRDGSPAFPVVFPKDNPRIDHHGMTLRDWFAGRALAGLMATNHHGDAAPRYAFFLADEMLKERVK